MLFRFPTIEDMPDNVQEDIKKDPELFQRIKIMCANMYDTKLIDRMSELVKELTGESDPDKRKKICKIFDNYKKEHQEVISAVKQLTKEEG